MEDYKKLKKELRQLLMAALAIDDYDTASMYRERIEQIEKDQKQAAIEQRLTPQKDNHLQYWDEPIIRAYDPYEKVEFVGVASSAAVELGVKPNDILDRIHADNIEIGAHITLDTRYETVLDGFSRTRKQRMIYVYTTDGELCDAGPTSYLCEKYKVAANTLTCRVRDRWADSKGRTFHFAQKGQLKYYGGKDHEE